MLCLDISGIAIVTVKGFDYCCTIHDISNSEIVHLLENDVFEDRRYIQKCISILRIESTIIPTI